MPEDRLARATGLADRAPLPIAAGHVLFGTAGWSDPTLIKSRTFYPRGASSAQARLEHYARHFRLVEVDASYYTLLPREVSSRWLEWTPAEFRFDVKAYPVLTGHPIDVGRLPADLKQRALEATGGKHRVYRDGLDPELVAEIEARFFDFVAPLANAGRLGCVMLQFPPWFHATRGNVRWLEAIRERWPDTPMSVEFRHGSWLAEPRRQRVLDALARLRMSYVVVDEPDVPLGGVPPVVHVTDPSLALVRFHGHNRAGWRRGASVTERFDYVYTPEELAAWVPRVRRLADEAREVHAIFNNCVRNYAVLNAKGLGVLLEQAGSGPTSDGRVDGG